MANDDVTEILRDISGKIDTTNLEVRKLRVEVTAQLKQTHGRIDGIHARIDRTNERLDQTNARLEQTNERLSQSIGLHGLTNVRIDQTNARLDQTNARLDQTNAELAETKTAVLGVLDIVTHISERLFEPSGIEDRVSQRARHHGSQAPGRDTVNVVSPSALATSTRPP